MNSICRCKPFLGTYVEISISAEESTDTLIDITSAAFSEIEKIENLMSFHNPESELSYLNKHAHKENCSISKDTETVLKSSVELSEKTSGLFDISVAPYLIQQGLLPDIYFEADKEANWQDIKLSDGHVSFEKAMLLDLGGIAKGYAVDKAISIFDKHINATVNAGGDIRMTHWQEQTINIRHPMEDTLIETEMRAPAIATSANYYLDGKNAIISQKLKSAIKDKRSISVFTRNCMLADALTKVAFLSDCDPQIMKTFDAEVLILSDTETNITH